MTDKPKDCFLCEHAEAIREPGTKKIATECRRFPPTPFILLDPVYTGKGWDAWVLQSAYPTCVDPCGEFKADESEQPEPFK